MLKLTNQIHDTNDGVRIGIVVDAGGRLGYSHAVRCLRLAEKLAEYAEVEFYPLSEACAQFIADTGLQFQIRTSNFTFPRIVMTDLRETHGITAEIHRQGALHISIHDLGLGQCQSNIAIDGSVVRLFPFQEQKSRELFLGPDYMITRKPATRTRLTESVFVALGGAVGAEIVPQIHEILSPLGLKVITTYGFGPGVVRSEEDISRAMGTCRFAISTAGPSLYDLLASGVPTIALSTDRLQLRTADAFHELGAALSGGLISRFAPNVLADQVTEMLTNEPLLQRMVSVGKKLVDGKGLSRVVEICTNAAREMQYV